MRFHLAHVPALTKSRNLWEMSMRRQWLSPALKQNYRWGQNSSRSFCSIVEIYWYRRSVKVDFIQWSFGCQDVQIMKFVSMPCHTTWDKHEPTSWTFPFKSATKSCKHSYSHSDVRKYAFVPAGRGRDL